MEKIISLHNSDYLLCPRKTVRIHFNVDKITIVSDGTGVVQ